MKISTMEEILRQPASNSNDTSVHLQLHNEAYAKPQSLQDELGDAGKGFLNGFSLGYLTPEHFSLKNPIYDVTNIAGSICAVGLGALALRAVPGLSDPALRWGIAGASYNTAMYDYKGLDLGGRVTDGAIGALMFSGLRIGAGKLPALAESASNLRLPTFIRTQA